MPKGQRLTTEQVERMRSLRQSGLPLAEIATKMGLSEKTVTDRTATAVVRGGSKWAILSALADFNGKADEADALVPKVGIDVHNIVHLLWALNKQGMITFKETRTGLADIRMTNRGWAALGISAGHEVGTPTAHLEPPRKKGDRTDFRTHGSTAEGGPVRHDHVPVPPAQPPVPLAVPQPPARIEPTIVGYPLINALLRRRIELEQAAALLERQGLDDLALAVLAKIDDISPLEEEIIRWASELDPFRFPAGATKEATDA